ncbi:MAG TPA: DUF885 domain-containing protein [Phycisphaerales bacterium]|nr:DUF885 domain-containing protein [Phycisphaerales bacterium]
MAVAALVGLVCAVGAAAAGTPAEEGARLNIFLEACFQEALDKSPEEKARLGLKEDADEWDDISDSAAAEMQLMRIRHLNALKARFDPARLQGQDRMSYRLFEYATERDIDAFRWRYHTYPVNQMYGVHNNVPAFLINHHEVATVGDAENYIKRLEGVPALFEALKENLRTRQSMGIMPPRFVFEHAINACERIVSGAPFDASGRDSTILEDFRTKVGALGEADRAGLIARAEGALKERVRPAYEGLIALLREQQAQATDDAGAWKLPDGRAFYASAVQRTTTTDLTPEQVHEMGLREVARIHAEMTEIMKKTGFSGSLADFFEHTRSDPKFFYPNNSRGRGEYLEEAMRLTDEMRSRLDQFFITKPKADMVVRPVEPFREKSAGKAFYNAGSPDGSRPGVYYVNLYNTMDMPRYQMEALAFHEGIPGHHMQISIAQELEALPRFRRFDGYTAYSEGWALYTEVLAKEMGFYTDPYSDFGRLAMELWRACRLVVDTGLHDKQWTREQAIDYLMKNTPNPKGDCTRAIERYIVLPGQATAYTVGRNTIMALRDRAKRALGPKFDIRRFHEVVLTSGAVPLDVLEEMVEEMIRSGS